MQCFCLSAGFPGCRTASVYQRLGPMLHSEPQPRHRTVCVCGGGGGWSSVRQSDYRPSRRPHMLLLRHGAVRRSVCTRTWSVRPSVGRYAALPSAPCRSVLDWSVCLSVSMRPRLQLRGSSGAEMVPSWCSVSMSSAAAAAVGVVARWKPACVPAIVSCIAGCISSGAPTSRTCCTTWCMG
jgi:hypothetical protein